jgi:hypothetical protein
LADFASPFEQGKGPASGKKKKYQEKPAEPTGHWKSLLIVNFPSTTNDDVLEETFKEMGYDVDNVSGHSQNKGGLKLQNNKSLYAFVNMRDADSASSFKKACEAGKIVLLDERKRHWQVAADWAKSNGRAVPKAKAPSAKAKGKKKDGSADAADAPQEEAESTEKKRETLDYLPLGSTKPPKPRKKKQLAPEPEA